MNKIAILGGGGVRTPLERAETIARMGREIVRRLDGGFTISVQSNLDAAAEGADIVLNSIRVAEWQRGRAMSGWPSSMVLRGRKPPGPAAQPWPYAPCQ